MANKIAEVVSFQPSRITNEGTLTGVLIVEYVICDTAEPTEASNVWIANVPFTQAASHYQTIADEVAAAAAAEFGHTILGVIIHGVVVVPA